MGPVTAVAQGESGCCNTSDHIEESDWDTAHCPQLLIGPSCCMSVIYPGHAEIDV